MPSDAATIILEYVCPTLGLFVGNYMFYAPYQDVQKAIARGSLGDLNPLPWVFMLGNCAAWVLYSILTRNFFVFAGNCPGFFLAVWFNLAASKLLYQQQFSPVSTSSSSDADTAVEVPPVYKTPRHDYWVMTVITVWMAVFSVIGFGQSLSADTKQVIVGVVANLNLSFFYGAPLSTIFKVIQERNSATIHFLTMVTNTFNGIFWAAYGAAVMDYYIAVPNGLGALLGFVQFALYFIFPRKETGDQIADAQKQVEGKLPSTDDEEAVASSLTTRIVGESESLMTGSMEVAGTEMKA